MPTQEEMIQAFQGPTRLEEVPAGYRKVLGPNAGQHYFIIETNGDLSVANDITVPLFVGHLVERNGHVGRFTEMMPSNTLDAMYQDLHALVAVVVKALQAKPGAW